MPKEGVSLYGPDEILRYEEILKIVKLAVSRGITKVRLTGGEPLVRKDVVSLIRQLSSLTGLQDLSMTTNGLLLADFASSLYQAGLKRVNISMDSLNPEKYQQITRGGDLQKVWAGIAAAQKVGFSPIKINVVAIAGFNDGEILDFARLTLHNPWQVRFIEYMPIGQNNSWRPEQFLTAQIIRERIESYYSLLPLETEKQSNNGPARLYKIIGAQGELGFISPISEHFCHTCNRLRITADGKLKTCLFSASEVDLKAVLRRGGQEEDIERELTEKISWALAHKPLRRDFTANLMKRCHHPMVKIGG
jgi:cyclic pyranopterin phosphate synthase